MLKKVAELVEESILETFASLAQCSTGRRGAGGGIFPLGGRQCGRGL